MRLAEVAVPIPLGRAFTYAVPDALAERVQPGVRVLCDFGRRRLLAVVVTVADRELAPALVGKVRPIVAVLDAEPVLDAELLPFLRELGAYYFAHIGEVLRLALPSVEREQVRALGEQGLLGTARVREVGGRMRQVARAVPAPANPGAVPRGQASAILEHLRASGDHEVTDLVASWGNARAALKRLVAAGLAEIVEREEDLDPFFANAVPRDVPPEATPEQDTAVAAITAALDAGAARGFLLHGVTGSGKTEVYLRAIAACRAASRGALVLVPEIALTPQLVSRFRARFGDDLAVIHSGLTDRERHAMWQRLRGGQVHVAIGARSALFAPVTRLGLVVVDEEHDGSFKQEEGTRYHARDMALLRAHRAGAVSVLGSATPSLETEALARAGRLGRLVLPGRAHRAAVLPRVELVDLKRIGAGPSGHKLLSLPLHRALERTLAAGEQAILFLNRRGFAPAVLCESCGAIAECPACAVALTFHRPRGGRVRCHYCDYDSSVGSCAKCGSARFSLEGLGTERLEETVAQAFPTARVARLDRDVAAGEGAEAVIARMRAGEIDVLVGTQMVTKGHDLPRVTLVGVVNADSSLALPEFRAAERTFQLLVQVAGRAGRADRPGLVIVQTRDPEHPAVAFAARHDVVGFIERELADRQELGYPPFARLALVRVEAMDEALAADTARAFADRAAATEPVVSGDVDVQGPAPAPLARLRGRYRFRVQLRGADRARLRLVLAALARLRDELHDRRVRVTLDVDPVQMM